MAVPGQRVGRAVLELVTDQSQYTSGLKRASGELDAFARKSQVTYKSMVAGMSAAGRETFGAGKLTAGLSAAGQQARAQQQAMAAAFSAESANKARAFGQMLQQSALASAAAQHKAAQASMTWGQRLVQVAKDGATAAKSNTLLAGSFGQLLGGFTAAQVAANAIGAITGQLGQMLEVGRRMPGMRQSFTELTASIGETAAAMLGEMRQGTRGMVTDFDLMQSANKAILLGLPVTAEEMRKLSGAATTLGRAMGKDAASSLDDLITALGRSSPLILDNLGLTVKVGEANEAYARTLGKTADELDDTERKMAFYVAAVAAAEDKVRSLGAVQITLTDRLQQTKASISNYVASIGEAANKSTVLIRTFDDTAEAASLLGDAIRLIGTAYNQLPGGSLPPWMREMLEWAQTIGNLGNPMGWVRAAAEARRNITAMSAEGMPKLPTSPSKAAFTPAFDPKTGNLDTAVLQMQNYVKQLAAAEARIAKLTPAHRQQIDAAIKLKGVTKELAAEYGLTETQLKLYTESTKKSGKGMSDAGKDAMRLAEQMQDLRMRFGGGDAIEDVNNLMRAFGNTIPFATMTVDAQREVAKVLYEGAEAWRAQGKEVPRSVQAQIAAVEQLRIIPDILKDITKFTKEYGAEQSRVFRQQQAEQAAATGSRMLEAVRAADESRRSTSKAIEDLEFQRAERVIDMAERQGATWQQVYAMERDLAQRRLQATLRDLAIEHRARIAAIDQTNPLAKAAAAQMEADHRAHVEAMVADFEWGEEQKRRELQRTHSFWRQLWGQIQNDLRSLQRAALGNLTRTLFGAGHDPDGSLKKAAQEAREAYEELTGASAEQTGKVAKAKQDLANAQMAYDAAKARKADAFELQGLSKQLAQARITYQEISKEGKGSAKEIQEAFDRMREAEEEANNGFGKRFASLWKDNIKPAIFNVFDSILEAFSTRLLDGMINAILGRRGGFSKAFGSLGSGIVAGDGSVGMGLGGGLLRKLGGLFGIGGGATAGTTSVVGGVPFVAGTGAAGGVGIAATGGGAAAGAGGAGAGGTAAGVGTGIGTAATIGITAGIAGAALLAWGIAKKGLFRGGAEALYVSPRRDQFFGQKGPPGTGPESGFGIFARDLAQWGRTDIFEALRTADSKNAWNAAQAAAAAEYAKHGQKIQTFHTGGMVTGMGEQIVRALPGEGFVSRLGMLNLGGPRVLDVLNRLTPRVLPGISAPTLATPQLVRPTSGTATGEVHHHTHSTVIEIKAMDGADVERVYKKHIRPQMKRDALLNSGGLTVALATAGRR